MKAAENKRSVMVGVFVSLAMVIFVVGIFTLGGKQKKFISSINIKSTFDDVNGLRPGNNVWFSGVKIGTVKEIKIHGNAQVEITMNIEEKAQEYIRKDAEAKISSESLIGNKNVVIFGGTPQAPAVQDGEVIKSAHLLSTDDMMATLQENNKNLLAITNDFKSLSAMITKGEGPMGTLLTDTVLAAHFRSVVTGLDKASANTVQASGALSQFTKKLNNKEGLANQLLTDTVVFSQLKGSVAQLQKTTTSAAQMANDLQQSSNKLKSDDNALGVLLTDEAFATELKTTMKNLSTSSGKFDQNMEALQHNFLLRGFFKKQEKNKAKELQKAQQEQEVQHP
jgi:phospholipid/cholesterol/gamma-HCH transport system substrate-binding protein